MLSVSPAFRSRLDGFTALPVVSYFIKRPIYYLAVATPEVSLPAWTIYNVGATAAVAGYILTLDIPVGKSYSLERFEASRFNNAEGTTISINLKLTTNSYITISFADGTKTKIITIYGTHSGGAAGAIICNNTSELYAMDTIAAFHTYTMNLIGNVCTISVDGVVVITTTADGAAVDYHIYFNSESAAGSGTEHVYIGNIKYNTCEDISSKVNSYGSIQRRGDQVISGDLTLEVENGDGAWSAITTEPHVYFMADIESRLSFADLPAEYITMFKGRFMSARFNEKFLDMGLQDRFYKFNNITIGTPDTPVSFSAQNPADILWSILTTYCGLSAITSAANPDIDYTAWSTLQSVLGGLSISTKAHFTGQSVLTILQSFIKVTNSAVYCENDGRIRPAYWSSQITTDIKSYNESNKTEILTIDMDATDLINSSIIKYDYDPATQAWTGESIASDALSQGIYGIVQDITEDTTIWHDSAASALAIAQRLVSDRSMPIRRVKFNAFLSGFAQQVDDAITITDSLHALYMQPVQIDQIDYDLGSLQATITGRLIAVFLVFFVLDDSDAGMLDNNMLT